jgi:predicted RNA binding protein YcfA (HicA-like mRNA interferase family)
MPKYDRDEAIKLLEHGVVKFEVLQQICETFFEYKRTRGSHRIYGTDYPDALVNIQPAPSGDAKRNQQRQVAALLRRQKGE